jgi:hypothetical protein
VVHPALVEIGRRRDRECCFEVRRTTGREQVLCGTEIGLPSGADFAIGPGEAGGPFNRIVSIRHFPDESVIFLPFGRKSRARVLHNHPVATLDKVVDVPGARPQALVVRQARQKNRKAPRCVGTVDVRAQCQPVAGRHRDILFDKHTILRRAVLRHVITPLVSDNFGSG